MEKEQEQGNKILWNDGAPGVIYVGDTIESYLITWLHGALDL